MIPGSEFIELDASVHNCRAFDCGAHPLNHFLRRHAAANRHVSKTMVLPDTHQPSAVCACYTLANSSSERDSLPSAMTAELPPHYSVPITLIARLAVHRQMQGGGLGRLTLFAALRHIHRAQLLVPSYLVVVDALTNDLRRFYQPMGFQQLNRRADPRRLSLPMKSVAAAVS